MAKRFVVDDKDILIEGNNICVRGAEAKHIKVLRHNTGDRININKYVVEISKIDKESVSGIIVGEADKKGVPTKCVTLIQSYLKSDKMEYVVQKAVELGVSSVLPVVSKNTVVKLDEKDAVKKVERLNKIAKEAIGQCGRTDSVSIKNVEKLEYVDLSSFDLVLLCYEGATVSLKDIQPNIQAAQSIAVIIGPEGGFDTSEVKLLCESSNVAPVVFGERILRAETASMYILSILDYLS